MKFLKAALLAALLAGIVRPSEAAIAITQIAPGALGAAGTTTSTTTTVDCPAGSLIIVLVTNVAPGNALSSVSDTAGNTYVSPFDTLSGTGIQIGWSYAVNTLDLPIGGSITATHAGAATARTLTTGCITGLVTSSPLDVSGRTANGVAATSATTVASGTLAQSSEILLGAFGGATGAGTVNCGTGWTSQPGGVNFTPSVELCYDIVASTASVNFLPTWGSSTNYITDIISLKGAGGGGTTPAGLTLMGVGP